MYVEDMRWLAELGASQTPPVKIAYECWCFSQHVNSWEQTWEIVKAAVGRRQEHIRKRNPVGLTSQDHPDLGLCLDTAHFPLSPPYGYDPVTGTGFDDESYQQMTSRLRALPAEKIFYVELSDVVVPDPPLYKGSRFDEWAKNNKPPRDGDRFIWTICGRPVPLVGRAAGSLTSDSAKSGARVIESLRAILDTGFKGTIIFEMFEVEYMTPADKDIPARYADACAESQRRLVEACW